MLLLMQVASSEGGQLANLLKYEAVMQGLAVACAALSLNGPHNTRQLRPSVLPSKAPTAHENPDHLPARNH